MTNQFGLIFDLDGTLIDSAPDIQDSINATIAEIGLAAFSLPEVVSFIGNGAKALVTKALKARNYDYNEDELSHLATDYMKRYSSIEESRCTLFPNVAMMLKIFYGLKIPMAVCTNKTEELSKKILKKYNLHGYFVKVIGSDSGYGFKPNTDGLDAACKSLMLTKEDCIFIGDSHIDGETAQSYGIKFALHRHGYTTISHDFIKHDIYINDFILLPYQIIELRNSSH